MEYTEQELKLMKNYEERTGKRIVMTFEEKCKIYDGYDSMTLELGASGIRRSINGRLNLDNADAFDGDDDGWKGKVLRENLEAIMRVLEERNK